MKSLKIVAALLVAVATWSATAEDSYIYWMVDPGAKYNETAGALSGHDVSYTYAMVKLDGNYLNIYNSDGDTGSKKLAPGVPAYAGIIDTSASYSTFMFELYNGAEMVGWTTLPYSSAMADYIYNTRSSGFTFYTVSSVTPEPTSGLLLLLGLSGLALKRKKAVA